jgi:2-oxoglutarate dehydrogenase E1 component
MRTPLIIMSPKSLLRNPKAVSSVKDLTEGSFQCVVDDCIDAKDQITKVVLCSGKVFYDLEETRNKEGKENIAIIRIEQLYPFPHDDLEEILSAYKNINEFVWCQEEPANQGAWFSHRHRIQRVLDRFEGNDKQISLVSRPAAAAPAVGMMKLHLKQQSQLIEDALK